MSSVVEGVRMLEHAPGAPVAEDEHTFLDELGLASIIRVPGKRSRPSRVVSGLMHGNEPSGLRAIHRYLRQLTPERAPVTDTYFFLGAVEAARLPPRLTRRRLPEGLDLNRCFRPPFPGREGAIAQEALAILRATQPEAVLDLHNNSGRNPAYGVVGALDGPRLALSALFAPRAVWSELRLGTFSEAFDDIAPSATIECGQACTAEADATALAGLERFLQLPTIEAALPHHLTTPMAVFVSPVQVKLRSGVGLAFAARALSEVEVTLDPELDRHNFQTVPAGEAIGWVSSAREAAEHWPFEAHDESGRECSRELLAVEPGARVIRTVRSFVPIMATTNSRIAADDCLFYATTRRE